MKRMIILAALALAAAVSRAGDIPLVANFGARDCVSLDGKWNYIVDPLENGYYDYRLQPLKNGFFKNLHASKTGLVEYDFDLSAGMDLPADWNMRDQRLFFYEGTVWFKRDFALSRKAGKRYVLRFGAVNYNAKVWVNGQWAGEHTGGYTPFNFDVTGLVKDGANFVVVKVDNKRHADGVPTLNMDWWNYGGITRSVAVAELPGDYVEDYCVQLAKGSQELIRGWVKTAQPGAGKTVKVEIPELKISLSAVTGADGRAQFEVKAKPALWSPESPKLYDVTVTSPEDRVTDRIGLRSITTDGKRILLNGRHVFLRGVSIHEEAPYGEGRAWSPEHAATLLGWAKEMGCNYVRLAHYPHNENMVRMAERMGLMVWSEIPVYWTIAWNDPDTYANAQNQLTQMVARDRNRCAVVIWSIANETPHGPERDAFLTRLARRARELDDTRLLSMAMEVTEDKGGVNTLSDNMNPYVDVVSFNQYVGWYRGSVQSAYTMRWEIPYDKPVIVSEFGGEAQQGLHGPATERWNEEYQQELYRANLAMLEKIDGLSGLSPWILVDFRSPRRQLPGVQDFFNRKGLISDRGIRKKAFYVMQEYYAAKAQQYANKK